MPVAQLKATSGGSRLRGRATSRCCFARWRHCRSRVSLHDGISQHAAAGGTLRVDGVPFILMNVIATRA